MYDAYLEPLDSKDADWWETVTRQEGNFVKREGNRIYINGPLKMGTYQAQGQCGTNDFTGV